MKRILLPAFTLLGLFVTTSAIAETSNTWVENGCELKAFVNNVALTTDGSISNNSLYFHVVMPEDVQGAPDIFVDALGDPLIHVEGFGRGFSFQILYTPLYAAKMMADNASIVVSYKNKANETFNAEFPTKNIPMNVVELSKKENCRIY